MRSARTLGALAPLAVLLLGCSDGDSVSTTATDSPKTSETRPLGNADVDTALLSGRFTVKLTVKHVELSPDLTTENTVGQVLEREFTFAPKDPACTREGCVVHLTKTTKSGTAELDLTGGRGEYRGDETAPWPCNNSETGEIVPEGLNRVVSHVLSISEVKRIDDKVVASQITGGMTETYESRHPRCGRGVIIFEVSGALA